MDFLTTESEAEFIESIRSIYRAYVPESDAWASPNFFDINAIVIGGMAWSAVNEARNGIDARLNPQTAVGDNLDRIAGFPPLNLVRFGETQATGTVTVSGSSLTFIPAGQTFTTAAGIEFTADADTPLAAGEGQVAVTSTQSGSANNSIEGQPLDMTGDGTAFSDGIFGASDVECDDEFRQRLFSAQSSFHFFGSACSYETAMLAQTGVSRAWAVEDGGVAKILFLMEGTYPCGEPTQADIDAIKASFDDACLTNMFFCPNFEGAKSLTISPTVNWTNGAPDQCEVEDALRNWLRENYSINEGVDHCEIQTFLSATYPDEGPVLDDCCQDYDAVCNAVYNCVEVIGIC